MSAKETKEKILKCTTELILERGGDIGNVTIRTIAARAGIGVGLANHYFESKEQLINECIDRVFSELFEMLTGEVRETNVPEIANAGSPEISPEPENTVTDLKKADYSDAPEEIADLLDFSDAPEEIADLLDFSDAPEEIADLLDFSDEPEGETETGAANSSEDKDITGGDDATHKAAKAVMDFLIRNEAISKAALVRDTQNPAGTDYTARLTDAFAYAMVDKKKLDEIENNDRMTGRMKEQFKEHIINEQKLKAFMIMSSVKEALLRREVLKSSMDIDLTDDEQRSRYVDSLMELLY